MDSLQHLFANNFPGCDLSCRECGSSDIRIDKFGNSVSATNPMGEDVYAIGCKSCRLNDEVIKDKLRETMKAWLTTSAMRYICCFNFSDEMCFVETTKGIGEFREGFWINEDSEYTTGSDCKFWVPPSKIHYIEKDETIVRLSE